MMYARKTLKTRAVPRTVSLICLALITCLCVTAGFAECSIIVVGSGGTSPVPVYRIWTKEYNSIKPSLQLQYIPLDTTASIAQITKGSGDFGGGDTPLPPERRAQNLMELPAMLIALVPIYNLPGQSVDLRFSGELLADIYLGQVTKWNAPQIARLNPGISLPDLPIKVVQRRAGKGTNYIFTDFLSKTSPKFRDHVGRSISPAWPVGTSTERSSDMADKVRSDPGSIGFVELQYARENNIPYGLVKNAAGKFIKASPAGLLAACDAVEAPQYDNFAASLTNAPGADSYPIVSFSWVYVRTVSTDAQRKAALLDVLNFMFTRGQKIMPAGYSPLPESLLAKEKAKLSSIQ